MKVRGQRLPCRLFRIIPVCANYLSVRIPVTQDMHNDIQDVLGQSYGVPDDIDEDDLMGELDALEEDMAQETEYAAASGVPSYLQVRAPHPDTQRTLWLMSISGCPIIAAPDASRCSNTTVTHKPRASMPDQLLYAAVHMYLQHSYINKRAAADRVERKTPSHEQPYHRLLPR